MPTATSGGYYADGPRRMQASSSRQRLHTKERGRSEGRSRRREYRDPSPEHDFDGSRHTPCPFSPSLTPIPTRVLALTETNETAAEGGPRAIAVVMLLYTTAFLGTFTYLPFFVGWCFVGHPAFNARKAARLNVFLVRGDA